MIAGIRLHRAQSYPSPSEEIPKTGLYRNPATSICNGSVGRTPPRGTYTGARLRLRRLESPKVLELDKFWSLTVVYVR